MRLLLQLLFLTISISSVLANDNWSIELDSTRYEVHMDKSISISYNVTSTEELVFPFVISMRAVSENADVATAGPWIFENKALANAGELPLHGRIDIKGEFLGLTRMSFYVSDATGKDIAHSNVELIVTRGTRSVDRAFTISVAILVILIYINFGCALNWSAIRPMLARPIAPILGLLCQFIVMPGVALALGAIAYPNDPALRLGLMFVGVSPAGGASNVWTCVLDGNVDLSVTMTALGTIAAFATMPLWLFTAGRALFENAAISVPYSHIASIAGSLLLPLAIGWYLQKRAPIIANGLARRLKALSAFLIILIVAFAVATNLHMIRLFTWRVAICGAILPWSGFFVGFVIAVVFRRPVADSLAIAIETGIQNTGIAIFLLRFSLPQPQADLTTVVPVAVAIATPVPLTILLVIIRVKRWRNQRLARFQLDSNNVSPKNLTTIEDIENDSQR